MKCLQVEYATTHICQVDYGLPTLSEEHIKEGEGNDINSIILAIERQSRGNRMLSRISDTGDSYLLPLVACSILPPVPGALSKSWRN